MTAGCLSVSANMPCRYNDIAFLVSQVDIAVGLDRLLQRIRPVDDRPECTRLGKFFQQDQVVGLCRIPVSLSRA